MRVRYLDGLGVVANKQRKLKSGLQFEKYFPKPNRTNPYLSYAGDTYDTVNFMSDIVKKTLSDTSKIAPVLKGNSLEATCRNIFNFIYEHIQYKLDSPKEEELRRPARAWFDRKTGVDCDCYSIFISSILTNLGIPHSFRKTKYSGRSYFQHIYVVVPKSHKSSLNRKGDYFTIDPVLDRFNEEKEFSEKYDQTMIPIRYLNGLGGVSSSLEGLGDIGDSPIFYSAEVAALGTDDAVFFDGEYSYMTLNGIQNYLAEQGMQGLGFFKKLKKWGKRTLKRIGKGIKNIGRRIVDIAKPIVSNLVPGGSAIMSVAKGLFSKKGKKVATLTPVTKSGLTDQQIRQGVQNLQKNPTLQTPSNNNVNNTQNPFWQNAFSTLQMALADGKIDRKDFEYAAAKAFDKKLSKKEGAEWINKAFDKKIKAYESEVKELQREQREKAQAAAQGLKARNNSEKVKSELRMQNVEKDQKQLKQQLLKQQPKQANMSTVGLTIGGLVLAGYFLYK